MELTLSLVRSELSEFEPDSLISFVATALEDDALEAAYDHEEASVSLCHHCADHIEVGEPLGSGHLIHLIEDKS